MWEILIPLLLLFIIALGNKIPKFGGNIKVALLVAALSSIIISGLGPKEIILAFVDGIDRLSWDILLSIFGAIYAESQVNLGAIDMTLNRLRSAFGISPKGLLNDVLLSLFIDCSFLGYAIAASAVIGFLVIHYLHEMKIKPEQIGMIILVGSSIGSIMPPITQGVFLSSSLIETDPSPVIKIAYITVGLAGVF